MFNQEIFTSPFVVDKVLKKSDTELMGFLRDANLTSNQLVKLQDRLKGAFLRDKAKRDSVRAAISQIIGEESIRLIESLVKESERAAEDPLQAENYLQENEQRINEAKPEVQRKIEKKILQELELHPEILQSFQLLELKSQSSRTGHLPTSSRRLLVQHVIAGTTPPPLKEREDILPGKEIQQVPHLKIQYILKLGAETVVGSKTYEDCQLLAAILANLNLAEMNKKFSQQGFRVNSIAVELKIILVGAYGSQVGSINEMLSADASQTAERILSQLQNVVNNIQNVHDDGIGLQPDTRTIMAIDEAFNYAANEVPVIPIIDSHILMYAGSVTRKSNKKYKRAFVSALIYDHPDGHPSDNLLIEKELRAK